MDLGAVKAASAGQLAACAASAARNGQALLHDAEVLVAADCPARAYSLAALAVEECGKAASLATLAVLPESVRAQAPAGRLLQWHQLKQVGGVLLTLMPVGTIASRLADLPVAEVTQIVCALATPADEADRLKRRGLYVDMDRGGQIRDPAEITSAEVTSQLSRARRAAESAGLLVNRELQAHLANPREEAIQLALALVSALAEAGYARTPQAAAEVILNAASKLRAIHHHERDETATTGHAKPGSVAELARTKIKSRRRRGCASARLVDRRGAAAAPGHRTAGTGQDRGIRSALRT